MLLESVSIKGRNLEKMVGIKKNNKPYFIKKKKTTLISKRKKTNLIFVFAHNWLK
jgi:hypothetical protein